MHSSKSIQICRLLFFSFQAFHDVFRQQVLEAIQCVPPQLLLISFVPEYKHAIQGNAGYFDVKKAMQNVIHQD